MTPILKLEKTLSGHASGIYCLTSAGGLLFSGSGDGMLAAWDIKTLDAAPFSVKVRSIYAALATEALLFIGQSEGGIHVVDRASRKEIRNLKFHEKGVFDILFHADANHLFSAGGSGGLSVFESGSFRQIIQIPLSGGKLRKLLLSGDGRFILAAGSDGYIHTIETSYFNVLHSQLAHEGGCYSMSWLSDGRLISGGRDGHLRIWQFSEKEGLADIDAIPAHNYAVYSISPISATTFASASRDRMVKVWDEADLRQPARLIDKLGTSHSSSANVVHSASGKLFSAGDDKLIKCWSLT